MPMSVLQIRIEEDLKKQVSDLFESLGMDIPTLCVSFSSVLLSKTEFRLR